MSNTEPVLMSLDLKSASDTEALAHGLYEVLRATIARHGHYCNDTPCGWEDPATSIAGAMEAAFRGTIDQTPPDSVTICLSAAHALVSDTASWHRLHCNECVEGEDCEWATRASALAMDLADRGQRRYSAAGN